MLTTNDLTPRPLGFVSIGPDGGPCLATADTLWPSSKRAKAAGGRVLACYALDDAPRDVEGYGVLWQGPAGWRHEGDMDLFEGARDGAFDVAQPMTARGRIAYITVSTA